MIIEFEDNALKDLYLTESTNDKNYKRLPKDIIKRYVKVVNYLRGAQRVEDLFLIKSLHYEKKVGNLLKRFGLAASTVCFLRVHSMSKVPIQIFF